MSWVRDHRPVVVVGAIVGGLALAWLAFGFFGVHTLFVDNP